VLPNIPETFNNIEKYKAYLTDLAKELDIIIEQYRDDTKAIDKQSGEFLLSSHLETANIFCQEFTKYLYSIRSIRLVGFKDDKTTIEIKERFNNKIKRFQKAIGDYVKAREELINTHRSYVPQSYAGILQYEEDEQTRYLVSTTGMQPCVGLGIFMPGKVGAVAHFDSSNYSYKLYTISSAKPTEKLHQEKESQKKELIDSVSKLVDTILFQMGGLDKYQVKVRIVRSNTDHEGLDQELYNIMHSLGYNTEYINVNRPDAALICDIKTGEIYTYDYKEIPFEDHSNIGETIKEVLGLPDNFQLYSVDSNQFIPQDIDGLFVYTNSMQRRDKIIETIATQSLSTRMQDIATSSWQEQMQPPQTSTSGEKRHFSSPSTDPLGSGHTIPSSSHSVQQAIGVKTQETPIILRAQLPKSPSTSGERRHFSPPSTDPMGLKSTSASLTLKNQGEGGEEDFPRARLSEEFDKVSTNPSSGVDPIASQTDGSKLLATRRKEMPKVISPRKK